MSAPQERPSKHGLRVEITNPRGIYSIRQDFLTSLPTDFGHNALFQDEPVSETELDGKIFWKEFSDVGMGASGKMPPHYSIRTMLLISDQELSINSGLYTLNRVKRLQEILNGKGIETLNISAPDSPSTSIRVLGESNIGIDIDLGLHENDYASSEWRNLIEKLPPDMQLRKDLIRAAVSLGNKPTETTEIGIYMVDVTKPGPYPWSLPFDDYKAFERNITSYGNLYEKLMAAFYQERGIAPPERVIEFGTAK